MTKTYERGAESRKPDRAVRNMLEKTLRERYDRKGIVWDGAEESLARFKLRKSQKEQLAIWDESLRLEINFQCQRHGVRETVYGAIFISDIEQAVAYVTPIGSRFVVVLFSGLLTAKRYRLFNLCSSPAVAGLLGIDAIPHVHVQYEDTTKAFAAFGQTAPSVQPGSIAAPVELADYLSNHWIMLHELGHIFGGHLGIKGAVRDESSVSDGPGLQAFEHAKEMEADRFAIRSLLEMVMSRPLPFETEAKGELEGEAAKRTLAFLAFYVVVRGFARERDSLASMFEQAHPPPTIRAHIGFQTMSLFHMRANNDLEGELATEVGFLLGYFETAIASLGGCRVSEYMIHSPPDSYTEELRAAADKLKSRLTGKRVWRPFAD